MLAPMRKLITLTLSILLLGLFAAVVFAAVDSGDDPSSATGTTETTETTDTTETTTTDDTTTTPGDDTAEDISGPCDEAEHANDPRCTGTGGERVDNSGPGSADSGHDNDDDNSGHGGGDDDSSGHGGGDDDDNSGHGGGGDDD
jgi:hypothetical protein